MEIQLAYLFKVTIINNVRKNHAGSVILDILVLTSEI